jgi:hypothetical protein
MSELWLRASLKLRIKAVHREVVVRHVLNEGGNRSAVRRCIGKAKAGRNRKQIIGTRLPKDVLEALDVTGSIAGPPADYTILEWVRRYKALGLVGLLERHKGLK